MILNILTGIKFILRFGLPLGIGRSGYEKKIKDQNCSDTTFRVCVHVYIPSLQMQAGQFLGVFWREHGGADLCVTAGGDLGPV